MNNSKNNHNDGRGRDEHWQGHRDHKHQPKDVILTSGITTVSDQSAAGTNYIFAGTSAGSEPTLQFIGDNSGATINKYTAGSFTVDGRGSPAYGAVQLGEVAQVEVTRGISVNNGTLSVGQTALGTVLIADGNSSINNNGAIIDSSGGVRTGGAFVLNGNLTLGPNGTNKFAAPVSLTGNGTIRETGAEDSVSAYSVGSGVHFDIEHGSLSVSGADAVFNGTIGPANGVAGPALGPDASVTFSNAGFLPSEVKAAAFDTSTGVLSFFGSAGNKETLHFTGDASGLNVSTGSSGLIITDHPGEASPIPITFT